jgi:hypothetical protein
MRSSSRRWLHSLGALALVAPASHARAEGSYDSLLAPASVEETLNQAPEGQVVPASLLLGGDDVAPDLSSSDDENSEPKPPPTRPYRQVLSGAYAIVNDPDFDVSTPSPGVRLETDPFPIADYSSFELTKASIARLPIGWRDGWRFDGFLDEGHVGFGAEVAPRERAPISGWRTDYYTVTGVRAYSTRSLYSFEGLGSILGRVAVEQANDHFVLGPQLGIGYVAERSIWRFEAKLLGLGGYGHLDSLLMVDIGEDSIPGALNPRAAVRQTTKDTDHYFAWHGETRLGIGCQVTKRIRADVTYRYMVLGPTYIADQSAVGNAPEQGIQLPESVTVDAHSLFVGASYLW